ncbi:helix-turn-helix domain-containing protein [Mycolicibacterium mageritense]|uniref:DNA-binding protein n=1 Tax=Mycolicibacterium mageritense TaxID=53462 RepID=A0ABM7HZD8_MYCME|nr:helix-turn-helix domain-containing protein [Mycolicibacterium mageritense]BBX35984.1 hypothetical protein MMAGJ_52660 [Mycolicibacterium mageritense]BBX38519.1 hypothetical protein MMAGJ_78010 [Mycolicibacterium mageritense]CDO24104.1 hypothetical protein BN978_04596 [Mycolicibacterium mageritense DSM 44476 = CIP 104973]
MTAPTKTGGKLPSMDAALEAVKTSPAISLAELAVLTGVSLATAQRHAAAGDLPSPLRVVRMGQRWIVPSVHVRELLGLEVAA